MKILQSFPILGIFLLATSIPKYQAFFKDFNLGLQFGAFQPLKGLQSIHNILCSTTEEIFLGLWDRTCRNLIKWGIVGKISGISKRDLSLIVTSKGELKDNFDLSNINNLSESEIFSENKTFTIFIPGCSVDLSKGLEDEVQELADAYGQREDSYIFAILDLKQLLDTSLYSMAALNTEEIGETFGDALSKFYQKVKPVKIHLIGTNLGAQIAASAAFKFNLKTGEKIDRITGLDPSIQCFKQGSPLRRLTKESAKFVDVLHTTKLLGTDFSVGQADFYATGYTESRMPGCEKILTKVTCSHKRAIEYYAESVTPGMEENFLACSCKSAIAFRENKCKKCLTLFGLITDPKTRGNFYFNTNPTKPYGQNKRKIFTTTVGDTLLISTDSSTTKNETIGSTTTSATTNENNSTTISKSTEGTTLTKGTSLITQITNLETERGTTEQERDTIEIDTASPTVSGEEEAGS